MIVAGVIGFVLGGGVRRPRVLLTFERRRRGY
jgi:hypothetical protein